MGQKSERERVKSNERSVHITTVNIINLCLCELHTWEGMLKKQNKNHRFRPTLSLQNLFFKKEQIYNCVKIRRKIINTKL